MKEKGTLLVVGSLLALSLATVTTARAAGTLNFTGKIINESCQIANNGGDVNVDFGNVDRQGSLARRSTRRSTCAGGSAATTCRRRMPPPIM
ncbi:hypothetical protein BME30_20505 [Klebsiella pneumoniae]|nr:hypothetical protein BME30_20505 [Klebsiella pneumoniae]